MKVIPQKTINEIIMILPMLWSLVVSLCGWSCICTFFKFTCGAII